MMMKKILITFCKIPASILIVAVAIVAAFSISPIYDFEDPAPFSGPDIFDPYADIDWNIGWTRANFHTHTRVNGPLNECPEWPDTVYRDYMKFGYGILTFSNHNELTTHPYDLALQVDVYEHGYGVCQYHKLVFGPHNGVNHFDHLLPLLSSQKQWQMDMLSRDADFVVMNHPDRTRFTKKRHMENLSGYRIMEGDSGVSTEFIHWDEALSAGHYCFGITNDDCHNSRISNRIAVRCSFLNSPSGRYSDIRETLLSGRFYSMRVPDYGDGDWSVKYEKNADLPYIEAIGARSDTVYLKLSKPAENILAIGQGHTTLADAHRSDSIEYVMRPSDSYVRLTAFFDDGAVIYTNAFARFDKTVADSPYRESPHPVNVPLTIIFNLLIALTVSGCIALMRLMWRSRKGPKSKRHALNRSSRMAAFVLILPLFLTGCGRKAPAEEETPVPGPGVYGFYEEMYTPNEGTVKTGETFFGMLGRFGVPTAKQQALLDLCKDNFDVRRMRAGQPVAAYYPIEDSLQTGCPGYIVYHNDIINKTVFSCADSLAVYSVRMPVRHDTLKADVTIKTSLWNDMIGNGASPMLILKLSDIYAWTVDFFGLQNGDRFRLIYSQSVCEGEVVSVDTVYYCEFISGEKTLPAIMYDQGDGGNVYWNEKGESMRRAFLKAPLHFSRISSGFSYHRKHPISGKVKAHTGVDYAAPTGTPVHSIGDGTVISVGWGGGGGNTVKIRHNSVYSTAYLHLSRYAKGLHKGQRVKQGEVIGYVGSTGSSTGPHLDFRVWRNGSPINPLTMESPSEEPIREANRAALDSTYRHYSQLFSQD